MMVIVMDKVMELQKMIDESNNIVFLVVLELVLKVVLKILEVKMVYIICNINIHLRRF